MGSIFSSKVIYYEKKGGIEYEYLFFLKYSLKNMLNDIKFIKVSKNVKKSSNKSIIK